MHCYLCARGVKQEEGRFGGGWGSFRPKRKHSGSTFTPLEDDWEQGLYMITPLSHSVCFCLCLYPFPSSVSIQAISFQSQTIYLQLILRGGLEKAASQTESGQCLTQGKSNRRSHVTCKNIVETAA